MSPCVRAVDNKSDICRADTAFKVFAENVQIAATEGILQAVALLFACFYIFNCNYNSGLKLTLTFLQKAILGIKDGVKTPGPVLSLLKKLNDIKQSSCSAAPTPVSV